MTEYGTVYDRRAACAPTHARTRSIQNFGRFFSVRRIPRCAAVTTGCVCVPDQFSSMTTTDRATNRRTDIDPAVVVVLDQRHCFARFSLLFIRCSMRADCLCLREATACRKTTYHRLEMLRVARPVRTAALSEGGAYLTQTTDPCR